MNYPDEGTFHRVHVLILAKDSNKSLTCLFYEIVIAAETPVDESVTPQGGGGGDTLIFSSYVGSGPASTVHPQAF